MPDENSCQNKKTHARLMQKICKKNAKNMQKNMKNMQNNLQNMQKICKKYAAGLTKIEQVQL